MSNPTPKKRRSFWASAYVALHRKGVVTTVYLVLRVLVLLTLVSQFLNGNFENVFFCVLSLVLFVMPTILERQLKIDLPSVLEIVILLFIFSAWILGEVQTYYTIFPYWDTMLHTLNGFLCAAIGFSLVDLLNRHERISLSMSPAFMAIVAFCFSMTVGVLWEFFECAMDQIFYGDMQKDTIVHAISSVMLDPTGGQRDRGGPDPPGPGGLPGHRPAGHHGGPAGELHRRRHLLHRGILLCEKPGEGLVCQELHPQGALRGGGRRRSHHFGGITRGHMVHTTSIHCEEV